MPAGQSPHCEAAATEKVPTAQVAQLVEADEPVTAEYLPAAQLAHAVARVVPAKVPTRQLEQDDAPAAEYLPAAQL